MDDANNPYLQLRAAKIARNEARLKELGLWNPPRPSIDKLQAMKSSTAAQKKRKTTTTTTMPIPSRRSTRLSRQMDRPNYVEDKVAVAVKSNRGADAVFEEEAEVEEEEDGRASLSPSKAVVSPSPSARKRQPAASSSSTTKTTVVPNSVRLIRLDPQILVHRLLGRPLDATGKDHVIHRSFGLAATTQDHERMGYNNGGGSGATPRLSFNKYSGVQEWRNVIFLWVNLHNTSSSRDQVVVNDFLNGGRQITWFGGSRMQEDSPVIQSLMSIGKNSQAAATAMASATSSSSSSPPSSQGSTSDPIRVPEAIILWCRRYDPSTKKFGSYVCLGRMGYHSHVVGSYPVAFTWNLLDYDSLVGDQVDPQIRDQFETMIG